MKGRVLIGAVCVLMALAAAVVAWAGFGPGGVLRTVGAVPAAGQSLSGTVGMVVAMAPPEYDGFACLLKSGATSQWIVTKSPMVENVLMWAFSNHKVVTVTAQKMAGSPPLPPRGGVAPSSWYMVLDAGAVTLG